MDFISVAILLAVRRIVTVLKNVDIYNLDNVHLVKITSTGCCCYVHFKYDIPMVSNIWEFLAGGKVLLSSMMS